MFPSGKFFGNLESLGDMEQLEKQLLISTENEISNNQWLSLSLS